MGMFSVRSIAQYIQSYRHKCGESPDTAESIKNTGLPNPGFHCVPVSKTDLFTRHST